jgi:hypothetical protein
MGTLSQSGARVADATDRIESSARSASVALPLQLLAARKYLSNLDAAVAANWAWTEAEQASKKTQEPARLAERLLVLEPDQPAHGTVPTFPFVTGCCACAGSSAPARPSARSWTGRALGFLP